MATKKTENAHAIEIERALLGAILVNEKSFHNIKGRLTADEFYDIKNSLIFQAIQDCFDAGYEEVEISPILSKLREEGNLEKAGGEVYIAELVKNAGLDANLGRYMKEISDKATLREIKEKSSKFLGELDDPAVDAAKVIDKFELDVLSTVRGEEVKEFMDSKNSIEATIKALEQRAAGENISGIPVEFPSLDNITGGFQRGDLIILAARPSMGKTALALNMAANASKKYKVAFFSLEMPTVQLYNRILSSTAFVNGSKLRDAKYLSENEWRKIYLAKDKLSKRTLFVDETAGIKLSELVWKAKRLHRNQGLDMIFIDYLQLVVASEGRGGESRQNEVSLISRTLKKLARDLNVPVIALSQLSRKVEERENKTPLMSDLRESGAIEQDADIISFVYRENYYKKELEPGTPEVTDVIISKHRNGSLGTVKLTFKADHSLFMEKGDN